MTEELKPCPFCGCKIEISDPDVLYPLNREMDLWNISCNGCSAHTLGRDKEEAIKAWNTRSDYAAKKIKVDPVIAKALAKEVSK